MLPKLGLPIYSWPIRGFPFWPITLNAPAFFVRFNTSTSVVLTSDCITKEMMLSISSTEEALSMVSETKGF